MRYEIYIILDCPTLCFSSGPLYLAPSAVTSDSQKYHEIMHFTSILAILAIALTAAAAPIGETNGQRMARGLPPLSPVNLNKRGTPVAGTSAYSPPSVRFLSDGSLLLEAKRGQPSGWSGTAGAKRGQPSGWSATSGAKRGQPSGWSATSGAKRGHPSGY